MRKPPSQPRRHQRGRGVSVDPVAHLRPFSAVVQLGEATFTVPALFAADWLEAIISGQGSLWPVLPGLLDLDDQMTVAHLLSDDLLSLEDLNLAALDLIEVASGHNWWWALRVISLATTEAWDRLYGSLLLHGVDSTRLSLAGWLSALYAMVTKDLPPDKIKIFEMDLSQPPEGFAEDLDEDAEGAMFTQMMQQSQRL